MKRREFLKGVGCVAASIKAGDVAADYIPKIECDEPFRYGTIEVTELKFSAHGIWADDVWDRQAFQDAYNRELSRKVDRLK